MKYWRSIIFCSLIFLLVTVMMACSTNQGANDLNIPNENEKVSAPPTAKDPEVTPPPKKDPIELVMWYPSSVPQSDEHFMTLYGDPIMKKFPYITPKFLPVNADNTFEKLVSSQHPIDLVSASIGATASHILINELQYDITEFIKKHNYDLSTLEPTTVEIQHQLANGGIYGLPVSTDTMTLFYNREIFDRFGVPQPTDNMTWQDLMEVVSSISRTEGDTRYWGLGISPTHAFQMDPLSPVLVDPSTDQPLLSTDVAKRAIETLTGLLHVSGNQVDETTWSYSTHLKLFQKDKTMAMLMGTSALGYAYFADKDELDWDVVSYPRYAKDADYGPQTYPVYYYVTSMSKHKEDAFLVSAYLTSREFQIHLAEQGALPILADHTVMDHYGKTLPYMSEKNIAAFLPQKFAEPAYKGEYQSIAIGQMSEAFRKIVLKETDINTALRDADEAINKAITERKAQR